MIALSNAVEPLRMANSISGQLAYEWSIVSLDGAPVVSSNGQSLSPTKSLVEMGPPIRVMLFSNESCNARERPTKAQTKATVKLLLERGADPNGSDANGNTALMEAASHGCDRELMRMLIKAGAKINVKNKSGLTPFEMGLFWGHDGLEEIIAAGYRLPPDKAKMYAEGYAGKPAVQAMIKKASAK